MTKIYEYNEYYSQLMELFSTIEECFAMEVCIYPAYDSNMFTSSGVSRLPHSYFSHFSGFCRAVKDNKTGLGCAGYDSLKMVAKSTEIGKPFVNVCHAGLSEVIIPVYGHNDTHIATIFIGQVITEEVVRQGFSEIIRRVKNLGVDMEKLEAEYKKIPHMSEEKLLKIGKMVDWALKGINSTLDYESLMHQIHFNQYPVIRQALNILHQSKFAITQTEIARKLHLHQSYFSRLFTKVMKCNFQEYVKFYRISEAKQMLHHSDLPISEIADSCGYSRQSFFTRQFKKMTGMTPREFRNKHNRA